MKKKIAAMMAMILALLASLAGSAPAAPEGAAATAQAGAVLQVSVYDTDGEGLALKESPDVNSYRYALIPEGELLLIGTISDGWGKTSYDGQTGWIALRYTKVEGSYPAQAPTKGYITPAYYTVDNTEGEGLELRTAPTVESSSFGPVPDGTAVLVQAIDGAWAYTSYRGKEGWANTTYLLQETFQVSVYDTDGEGLALKSEPDLGSQRYLLMNEDTVLDIDGVTGDGWGHTVYNGYDGWLSLRYTKILGAYKTQEPAYGYITPVYYTVYGTEGEGLELRTKPTVETSTFGPLADGTKILVEAVIGDWAYTTYNDHKGWANLTYLRSGSEAAAPAATSNSVFDYMKGATLYRTGLASSANAYITFTGDGFFDIGGTILNSRISETTLGSGRFANVQEIYTNIYRLEMADVDGTVSGSINNSDGTSSTYEESLTRLNGDVYYLLLPGAVLPDALKRVTITTDSGNSYTADLFGPYTGDDNRLTRIVLWKYDSDRIFITAY